MRIDWYTKTILTVIAACLMVLVLRPLVQPSPVLGASENIWNDVKFGIGSSGPWVLQPNSQTSGRAFLYSYDMQPGHKPKIWQIDLIQHAWEPIQNP